MELELFRTTVRKFIHKHVLPDYGTWEAQGFVPKDVWRLAGRAGLLCPDVEERYGGAGLADYRFTAVMIEEFAKARITGFDLSLHNDMVAPYIARYGTERQKQAWLPSMVSGDTLGALAFSEARGGSDLSGTATLARKTSGGYLLSGQKSFINNGHVHDFAIVAARTTKEKPLGLSLFIVERSREGFLAGPILKKLGLHAQDTSEIYLDEVLVPEENLIGRENGAFAYIMDAMKRERLAIALSCLYLAESCLQETIRYTSERQVFRKKLIQHQHPRFVLAAFRTKLALGRAFAETCIASQSEGTLKDEEAAMIKWWATEMLSEVTAGCLQLHGGAGYMSDHPVAQCFLASPAARIYGGTSEVMLEIVASAMDRAR